MPFSKVRCLMASRDDYELRLGNIADRLGEGRTGESRTNYRTTQRVLHAHPAGRTKYALSPTRRSVESHFRFSKVTSPSDCQFVAHAFAGRLANSEARWAMAPIAIKYIARAQTIVAAVRDRSRDDERLQPAS